MPNRILKESICVSDSINELGWFEEVLFYRLIVSCDDFGRYDGRPAIIKNRLFPLKENLTIKAVTVAIEKLANVGLVALYEFEGKPYLHLPSWNEHQTRRANTSKYPAPEDGVKASEIICKQMQTDVHDNVNENDKRYSINDNGKSGAFESFWKAYPKKTGKDAAERAFAKVKEPVDTLLDALEWQRKSDQWTKNNGQYIPNPATWLNQGRWKDEPTVSTGVAVDGSYTPGQSELESIRNLARRRGFLKEDNNEGL